MSARDSRQDPRPGDVLLSCGTRITVTAREGDHVEYKIGRQPLTTDLERWREWSNAAVPARGDA